MPCPGCLLLTRRGRQGSTCCARAMPIQPDRLDAWSRPLRAAGAGVATSFGAAGQAGCGDGDGPAHAQREQAPATGGCSKFWLGTHMTGRDTYFQ